MPRSCADPAAVATAVACAVIILILILVVRWCADAPPGKGDAFYTGAATEEPTRSEVPYVGTIPSGPWGVYPWAVAAPGLRCRP